MSDFNVPGVGVAVVIDATIAWRRGFGFRNASARTRVDDDTIFQAGSMSKPVFAYAVLKLCEGYWDSTPRSPHSRQAAR